MASYSRQMMTDCCSCRALLLPDRLRRPPALMCSLRLLTHTCRLPRPPAIARPLAQVVFELIELRETDTARAMLGQAEKFADVVKIRRELKATAELARTITWTGTAEQKRTLKEARASILAAVKEAKRSLHESLAAEPADHDGAHDSAESLSAAELKELRTILAKLTQ